MISTNYMALGSQKKIAKMPAYTGSGNTHSPSAQTDNTKSQSSFVFSLDMTKKAVQYSILNIGSRGTEVKKLQETLTKLSTDENPGVRACVAGNPNTPIEVRRTMEKDESWFVRYMLGNNENI